MPGDGISGGQEIAVQAFIGILAIHQVHPAGIPPLVIHGGQGDAVPGLGDGGDISLLQPYIGISLFVQNLLKGVPYGGAPGQGNCYRIDPNRQFLGVEAIAVDIRSAGNLVMVIPQQPEGYGNVRLGIYICCCGDNTGNVKGICDIFLGDGHCGCKAAIGALRLFRAAGPPWDKILYLDLIMGTLGGQQTKANAQIILDPLLAIGHLHGNDCRSQGFDLLLGGCYQFLSLRGLATAAKGISHVIEALAARPEALIGHQGIGCLLRSQLIGCRGGAFPKGAGICYIIEGQSLDRVGAANRPLGSGGILSQGTQGGDHLGGGAGAYRSVKTREGSGGGILLPLQPGQRCVHLGLYLAAGGVIGSQGLDSHGGGIYIGCRSALREVPSAAG